MPIISKHAPNRDSKPPIIFDIDLGYSLAIYASFVFSGMFFVCAFLVITPSRTAFIITAAVWGIIGIFLIAYRRFVEWLDKTPVGDNDDSV